MNRAGGMRQVADRLRLRRSGIRDQQERHAIFRAPLMQCPARNQQYIALHQQDRLASRRAGRMPLAHPRHHLRASWRAANFVQCRAVDDLHNMIAALVPLELGSALVLLRGQNDLHWNRLGVVQPVVARLRVERLHIVRELTRLEQLDWLSGSDNIRAGRSLRHRHQRIGKGETCRGGNGSRAEKVAARRLLSHARK